MIDKKELSLSVLRTLISTIDISGVPGIGQALNEILDYRNKIKQNRLNQFTELLENFFSNHHGIGLENFQTEEFGDLFESVIRRVVQTKSRDKLNMFKNILVSQIINPQRNIDYSETFLDLIASLSILEMKILYEHGEFEKYFYVEQTDYNKLEQSLEQNKNSLIWVTQKQPFGHEGEDIIYKAKILEIEEQIPIRKAKLDKWQEVRTHQHYNINENDFLINKQHLLSLGLLRDNGVGASDFTPFITMSITEFGLQFIDYVMNIE